MERRLAAILATDVVGYSRLITADEEGTIAALKALRADIIDPKLAEHHGRLVKLMGDGMLAEFASVVDAVRAAVETQQAVAERNADIPEEKRLEFRVGINLGDVVIDGEDIQGDGVNVAARLEGLAQPGGICISGSVHEQVRDRLDLPFEDLGDKEVKNIARPVRVWQWMPTGPAAEGTTTGSAPLPLPDKPSIAVLPFTNMSGDPEQDYFSDGITEDVITALARCRWLFVVARNSTFAYKGKSVDVRRIADQLGARYVLEGSVRRLGDRVRVTAQLIDGRDGNHLWGERYDRKLDDIFVLQDEIAGVIAGTIEPELGMIQGAALRDRRTVDLNAWDCYQRALWHLYRFTTDELEAAKRLFERAIALDPGFGLAFARLAYVHIQFGWYGPWEDRAAQIGDATVCAERAVELDDKDPAARLSLGRALALSGAIERGIEELRTAVELDPSFAQAHFALGQALCFAVQPDEALSALDEALRLSPRDPHIWTFYNVRGVAHRIAGDFEQAENDLRTAMRQPNSTFWPVLNLVAILGRQGRAADAEGIITVLHRNRPGFRCADARHEFYFGDRTFMPQSFVNQFLADLKTAGLPD